MFELIAVLIAIVIFTALPAVGLYLAFQSKKTVEDEPKVWRDAADALGLTFTGESLDDLRAEGEVDDYPVVFTSRVTRETYRDNKGRKRTRITYHLGHEVRLRHPGWQGAEGLMKYQQRPMIFDDPRPGISDRFLKTFQFRGERAGPTDSVYGDPLIQQALLELTPGLRQLSLTNGLIYTERGKLFGSSAELIATTRRLLEVAQALDGAMNRSDPPAALTVEETAVSQPASLPDHTW